MFRSNDIYNREISPDIFPRLLALGLIRANTTPVDWPTSSFRRGQIFGFKSFSLSPRGRDVRDCLLDSPGWRRLVTAFEVLERTPVHEPPPCDSSEWFSFSPRRRISLERLVFCPKGDKEARAYIIC